MVLILHIIPYCALATETSHCTTTTAFLQRVCSELGKRRRGLLENPTDSDLSIVIPLRYSQTTSGLDITTNNGSLTRPPNTLQRPANPTWSLQNSRRTQVASFVLPKILIPRRTSRRQPQCQRQQLVATGSIDNPSKSQITPFSRRLDKMGRSCPDGVFHGLWSGGQLRV